MYSFIDDVKLRGPHDIPLAKIVKQGQNNDNNNKHISDSTELKPPNNNNNNSSIEKKYLEIPVERKKKSRSNELEFKSSHFLNKEISDENNQNNNLEFR